MRRVELIDTSVLVEVLGVPFEADHAEEVTEEFEERRASNVEFFLPVASIIEAGDHVGRIENGHERRQCARRLEAVIRATLDGTAPWSFNPLEWNDAFLREVLNPDGEGGLTLETSLAAKHLEMGDLAILAEFRRFRESLDLQFVDVDVWTLDNTLRAVVDDIRA